MELIEFIFSSPWIFLGVVVIIVCIGGIIKESIRQVGKNKISLYLAQNARNIEVLKKVLGGKNEDNTD